MDSDFESYVDEEVYALNTPEELLYDFTIFKPASWYENDIKSRWVYDTEVRSGPITWDQLVSLFVCESEIIPDKPMAYMFNGCKWKSLDDEGVITKHHYKGYNYVSKCAENVISTSLLILDYDNGQSIEQIEELFKDYRYILYTSFGNSLQKEKFRVIIPLTSPIPIRLMMAPEDTMESILPALFDVFGGIDITSFDLSRSFFMPCCSEENCHLSYSSSNEGMEFDWTMLPITHTPQRIKPVYNNKNTTDIVQAFKNKGWYVGRLGGKKHQVLCPWIDTHTTDPENGAVVWENEGFHCQHEHCKKRTHKEVIEALGIWQDVKKENVLNKWARIFKERSQS